MANSRPCLGNNPPPFFPSLSYSKRPSGSPPSPSHSRSPVRPVAPAAPAAPAYQLDPLLRSLSPEATLQALSSTDAVPNTEKAAHDILSQSISQVPQADRALGIRAAVCAKNLSLWYKEVQSWNWPKRSDAHLGKAFIPPPSTPSSALTVADAQDEYYGSLPASVVEQHESRIEEIRDGMESLGVDELKEHVLNAHIPSRSRPSSSNSTMSVPPPLSYVQLSDFTAVVTATILRALPILSRLNSLLSTWDVRLLVLRQIPGLLRALSVTRATLDDAFRNLKSRDPPSEGDAIYSRSNFYAKQTELGAAVASAGRRMDNVLDALEGREDSLPENWIDDLEAIESDFSTWVVEAEKRSAENEWMRLNAQTSQDHDASLAAPHQPSLSRSLDETPHVPESSVSPPDSTRRNGRPFLMETIQEEPFSVLVSGNEAVKEPAVVSNSRETSVPASDLDDHVLSHSEELPAGSQEEITALPDVQPRPSPLTHAETGSEAKQVPQSSSGSDRNVEESHSSSHINVPPSFITHEAPPDSAIVQVPDVTKPVADEPSPTAQDFSVPDETDSPKASESSNSESSAATELRYTDESPSVTIVADVASDIPAVSVVPAIQEEESSSQPTNSSPSPSKPHLPETDKEVTAQPSNEDASPPPPKQPLESPIKLSKIRQAPKLDKNNEPRRTSDTSADSLSDYPSLMSSPEIREPHTASLNGKPLFLEAHPQFQRASLPPSSNDYTLREDHLRRFDDQKASAGLALKHNRAVSLPLQRFIDERLDMNYENNDAGTDAADSSGGAGRRPSSVASRLENQGSSSNKNNSAQTTSIQRLASQRFGHSREAKPPSRPKSRLSEPWDHTKKAPLRNAAQRSLNSQPPARLAANRLSKGLNTYRSAESLRHPGRDSKPQSRANTPVEAVRKNGSGSSTPSRSPRRSKDHLDEKISTILDTLPARIQLLSGQDDSDASSVASSVAPQKHKERFRSVSSGAAPHASGTPAPPSLTLTPAVPRRRQSHAHGPEESSVKLYHLHKGGKTNPTKLFVRSVGERGERVMVRVGGGWADLGEYLREYAIHHGRRHVSDTPRVEVQGLPSGNNTTAATNAANTANAAVERPRSVLSNRPTSSLAVRKTRRASNVSDAGPDNRADIRAVSMGDSPLSSSTSRRRLSVSSNNSVGTTSLASETHHASCYSASVYSPTTTIAAGSTRSTPLGLAGPKPRSRHVSMSPESEAWVEDVLGQARRSSLRPGPPPPVDHQTDSPHGQAQVSGSPRAAPILSKVRSVGDMGSLRSVSDIGNAGTSRRVALRGLGGSRRSSRQG